MAAAAAAAAAAASFWAVHLARATGGHGDAPALGVGVWRFAVCFRLGDAPRC